MTGLPFILKGFLIGIIAAIPIGPVLMLTIQKSVSDGRKAGFSCGLGGTAVDTLCAIISAFALSGIGDYVQSHTTVIELVGGLFIMFVGFNMFRTHVAKTRRKKPYSAKNFVKAFTMGLSNPAAIAVMLALFTFFKMDMRNIPQWIPVQARSPFRRPFQFQDPGHRQPRRRRRRLHLRRHPRLQRHHLPLAFPKHLAHYPSAVCRRIYHLPPATFGKMAKDATTCIHILRQFAEG